jgi:hypothetical protein
MAFYGWRLANSLDSGEYTLSLEMAKPAKLFIENRDEIHRHFDAVDRGCAEGTDYAVRNSLYHQGMPTPKLVVTDKKFQSNFFHMGLYYISTKLRKVIDLPSDTVRYLDIDTTACPKEVQAMDYEVMNLLCAGNPRYMEKPSDYASKVPKETLEHFGKWLDLPQKDGSVKREWLLSGPHALPIIIGFKEDFTPPAPLFLSEGGLIASDELAERVLRSGITDVAFYDITNDGTQTDLRWKTLA